MRRRLGQRDRGQTLVEFALILPIFVLVVFGIFDLGRAVYAYHTVNNAAREGGRLAIVDQTTANVQAEAAQHAVALGVPAATVVVDFRGIATPDVVDSCDALVASGKAASQCVAFVRVPYTFTAATPIVGAIVGQIQIAGETRFPIEYSCVEPGGSCAGG